MQMTDTLLGNMEQQTVQVELLRLEYPREQAVG